MTDNKSIEEVFEGKSERKERNIPEKFLPFGCTLLDLVVGGGDGMGMGAGKVLNIQAEKSAGKTFVACEMIAASRHKYKNKLKWVYDDAEHALTLKTQKLYGFEIIPEDAVCSETVEDLYYNIRTFLKNIKEDEVGIYVIDSLDALMSDETEERANERMKAGDRGEVFDKGSYGMGSQKFLSQEFFRKIKKELADKNCVLVFISQYRDNVNAGLYGEKRRVSGGSALRYYNDTELRLRVKEVFERKGRAVGVCIEAETIKSKTSRPYRSAFFNLLFDYGIDDISSNIDYLFDLKSEQTGKLGSKTECNLGDTSDPRYGKYAATLDGWKSLLKDEGLFDACISDLKANKITCNKAGYSQWLKDNHPDIYSAYFGEPIDREDYILKADKDKALKQSLRAAVIDKWEEIEDSISTGRTKYGDEED